MTTTALFSAVEPDPVGLFLGTGHQRFQTAFGIEGLAKWEGDRLDILAVLAVNPGRGNFRRFIEQAKKHFRQIYVWHEMNPIVGEALARYGFVLARQTEPDGELLTGWKWAEENPCVAP